MFQNLLLDVIFLNSELKTLQSFKSDIMKYFSEIYLVQLNCITLFVYRKFRVYLLIEKGFSA